MRPTPKEIKLSQLASQLGYQCQGDALVTGVAIASGNVQPGDVFVALPGKNSHGVEHLDKAIANGAVAVITDKQGIESVSSLPVIQMANPRKHLFDISRLVYDYRGGLQLFGITGTNGKTSSVEYLYQILKNLGRSPLRVSSLGMELGRQTGQTSLTTPEVCDLVAALAYAVEQGANSAVIEVSAQALVRSRVDGLVFDVAGFTGLSHDHLDDFGDMDSYLAAKARLFEPELSKKGVVFLESKHGLRLSQVAEVPVTTVSLMGEADYRLTVESKDLTTVSITNGSVNLEGSFSPPSDLMARNYALAMLMLLQAGYSAAEISKASSISIPVPGRLQQISSGPDVYLDYGHTPDAIFQSLKELSAKYPQVHLVLGFSGDRDHSKRKPMLDIAESASSLIATIMHPRSESEQQIIYDLKRHKPTLDTELDPAVAIGRAISIAEAGAAVLWCGPGHLKYREIAGEKVPFDPEKLIKKAMKK